MMSKFMSVMLMLATTSAFAANPTNLTCHVQTQGKDGSILQKQSLLVSLNNGEQKLLFVDAGQKRFSVERADDTDGTVKIGVKEQNAASDSIYEVGPNAPRKNYVIGIGYSADQCASAFENADCMAKSSSFVSVDCNL